LRSDRPTAYSAQVLCLTALFFGSLAVLSQPGWGIAKVYLKNGETRQGTVIARDGRITIVGKDRLFQHPESAVHRIDYVSGETTLVTTDGVLLREKPEKFGRNLIAIPKGCEVRILGHERDWTSVEVYGGKSLAKGYLHDDDLGDSVFFSPIDPRVVFKDPPRSLEDRFTLSAMKARETKRVGDLIDQTDETEFRELLSERLYGQRLEDLMEDKARAEKARETESSVDEELPTGSQGPK